MTLLSDAIRNGIWSKWLLCSSKRLTNMAVHEGITFTAAHVKHTAWLKPFCSWSRNCFSNFSALSYCLRRINSSAKSCLPKHTTIMTDNWNTTRISSVTALEFYIKYIILLHVSNAEYLWLKCILLINCSACNNIRS